MRINVMEYLKERARKQQILDDEMKTSEEELMMAEMDRHDMESAVVGMLRGAF